MAMMTHAKFHFSQLMVTLIFGIWASEPPSPRAWQTTQKVGPERVNRPKISFGFFLENQFCWVDTLERGWGSRKRVQSTLCMENRFVSLLLLDQLKLSKYKSLTINGAIFGPNRTEWSSQPCYIHIVWD